MNLETYDSVFESVSNWGRWGADDEAGAVNFITQEQVVAALGLVRSGKAVSLAMPIQTTGPAPDGRAGATHLMTSLYDAAEGGMREAFVGHSLALQPHGHGTTHLDALCHMAYRGRLYNGLDAAESVRSSGAAHLGVEHFGNGILGRGVLLDIPAALGIEWLEPGDTITPADLELAEDKQQVDVTEGDLVFVRTGRHEKWRVDGPWNTRDAMPGLHADALPWLHDRRVALVGSDSSNEALPSSVDGLRTPIHLGLIVAMGVPLIDNCQLEDLAVLCADEGRWAFFVIVAPIRLGGGTGAAVNPIAVL